MTCCAVFRSRPYFQVGGRYYAMQIWVDPAKLANFGLTIQDLQSALKDQNRESAAGVLGQQPVTGLDITIPITAQGRLSTALSLKKSYFALILTVLLSVCAM